MTGNPMAVTRLTDGGWTQLKLYALFTGCLTRAQGAIGATICFVYHDHDASFDYAYFRDFMDKPKDAWTLDKRTYRRTDGQTSKRSSGAPSSSLKSYKTACHFCVMYIK